jgi:DNA polymerase (family 10)
MTIPSANEVIAEKLREMADLLDQQQADNFRVSAYRKAAQTLIALDRPVEDTWRSEGLSGLVALPGIGRGIGAAISEMLSTGRWAQLERLTGATAPEALFQTVPGIGPKLAERIHDELHVDTLEELELAAHDARLESVHGVGRRRAQAIRAILDERLGHRRVKTGKHPNAAPPVAMLLDVDAEYRKKDKDGMLRKIAPKRFNPSGEAWLSVLHTQRSDWRFTALYSNTRTAHKLGRSRDWVVIYYHRDNEAESQCTVVTETRGSLAGRRIVRGREGECTAYYAGAHGS